jgi:hypothetical protein
MRDWDPHWGQVTNASPRAILVYPPSHEPGSGPKKPFAISFRVMLGMPIGLQNNLGMSFGWNLHDLTNFPGGAP